MWRAQKRNRRRRRAGNSAGVGRSGALPVISGAQCPALRDVQLSLQDPGRSFSGEARSSTEKRPTLAPIAHQKHR